jgi:hypothetical protein
MTIRKISIFAAGLFIAAAAGAAPAGAETVTAASQEPGFRVEAVSLKRDGAGAVTLTFRIYNDTDKNADYACELRADGGEGCKQVTGVYLIDGVNKKRHLVVRDSDGKCICTDTLSNVDAKGSVTVWAKFPAPPDDVKQVTVVVPTFLPLENVPVE